LSKGYLSRLENGATRAGFEKIVALAKAYGVPVDVLAERLWLDLELEKNDPPETEGMTFPKLAAQAYRSSSAGWKWRFYAYARDAVVEASVGSVGTSFATKDEQVATALQNCASAATALGAFHFALWEYRFVETMNALSPQRRSSFLVSFAILHRRRHEFHTAREIADRAIDAAKSAGALNFLGYAYSTRALIDREQGNFESALEMQKLALSAYRAAGQEAECASAHHAIGEAFAQLGRPGAAKRSFGASERIALRYDLHDARVRVRLSLGELASRDGNLEQASAFWFEAADIARHTRDKTLLFMAEFRLLRQAVSQGRRSFSQALARRLQRLTPWILPSTDELDQFRRLVAEHDLLTRRRRSTVPD
jgi:tetratricopeptide (TPR) repeat protein